MAYSTDTGTLGMLERKRNKYNAVSAHCSEGHFHRSKGEAGRCSELHLLQRAREIRNIKVEPRVMVGPISYNPDWTYTEGREEITEDFKGVEGERFRMIKKLWPTMGRGTLRVTKKHPRTGRTIVTKEIRGITTKQKGSK